MAKHLQAVGYVVGGLVTAHCLTVAPFDGSERREAFNVENISQDALNAAAEADNRDTWNDTDVATVASEIYGSEILPTPAPPPAS